MFYIERSCTGPLLCSDTHYCLGMDSEGLGWFSNGSKALAFPTKEEAEEFCATHNLSLDHTGGEYDPRYIVVEELRLPEVKDIADKYGLLFRDTDVFITWGAQDYRIRIVMNTDIEKAPYNTRQKYEYVVGARLVKTIHGGNASTTIIEEIHNPSYKQLDEFVAKCVREHKVGAVPQGD